MEKNKDEGTKRTAGSGRRVGTLTLGIIAVVVGVLSLIWVINPDLVSMYFISRLWPAVLILIGIEVLAAYAVNKPEKLRYDGWAVVIVIALMLFAGGMAAVQMGLEYMAQNSHIYL